MANKIGDGNIVGTMILPRVVLGGAASGVAGSRLGDPGMGASFDAAGRIVRDRLAAQAPHMLALLRGLQRSEVLTVDGLYDQMHLLLDAASIPYTRTTSSEINNEMLAGARFVFVNCGSDFEDATAKKIAGFVADGGLLLTTDFAMRDLLQKAFPAYVQWNGRSTGNEFVEVDAVRLDDPLTHSLFEGQERPIWWLEGQSHPIERLHADVDVLVRSQQLKNRHGNGSVIVRFPFGNGGVYHLISHLWLQHSAGLRQDDDQGAIAFAAAAGATGATINFTQGAVQAGATRESVQAATAVMGFVTGLVGGHLQSGTATFRRLKVVSPHEAIPLGLPDGLGWGTSSPNFVWDAERRVVLYRMPLDRNEVTIGRQADESLSGDKTLSRKHVLIRRIQEGDTIRYALTVLSEGNFVRVKHNGVLSGQLTKSSDPISIAPGDTIRLATKISFRFDPRQP